MLDLVGGFFGITRLIKDVVTITMTGPENIGYQEMWVFDTPRKDEGAKREVVKKIGIDLRSPTNTSTASTPGT
jgi:hypothetical protein